MGQTSNPNVSKFKLDGQFLIGQNSDEMHLIDRALINLNTDVYTDNSIIFNKIRGGSRAAFLINPKLKNELSNRTWQTVREESFTSPRRKLELFKMVRGVCISHWLSILKILNDLKRINLFQGPILKLTNSTSEFLNQSVIMCRH